MNESVLRNFAPRSGSKNTLLDIAIASNLIEFKSDETTLLTTSEQRRTMSVNTTPNVGEAVNEARTLYYNENPPSLPTE